MGNYKEETINSYNKHAKKFSEKFQELMTLNKRYEFKRFVDLLPGKKILDLGCGAGDHAYYFSKQGLQLTCVDLSTEMIKLCKEKGLNAHIMDIEDLKFEANNFDGIWAVTSLLHIPKLGLPSLINKLWKILKKNGILYVCVKEGEGERLIEDKGFNSKRFFSFWKKEEIIDLFKKNFSLIEFREAKLGHTNFLMFFFRKT